MRGQPLPHRLGGRPPRRQALLRHLERGGVVAYPTASCFGLGCLPGSRVGLGRIIRLKGRKRAKGMIVIASRFAQLAPLCAPLPAAQLDPALATWPGPHTWLVPASSRVPRLLRGRHDTLAVRVDAHPVAAGLCRMADSPLVSTSANKSGRKSLKTTAAVRRAFGSRVLVIPGRIGRDRKPSTIHDLKTGRILR